MTKGMDIWASIYHLDFDISFFTTRYDLEERTARFGEAIIEFVKTFSKDRGKTKNLFLR